MSNNPLRPVAYSSDGTERSVSDAFRNWSLESVLLKFNSLSASLIQGKDVLDFNSVSDAAKIGNGAQEVHYQYKSIATGRYEDRPHYLTGWELVDASYYAIKYTNDYRGRDLSAVDYSGFYFGLLDSVQAYHERKEGEVIAATPDNQFLLYLWGFAGEQFLFETVANAAEEMERELYIIFDCGKAVDPGTDYEKIVLDEIGVSPVNVLSSLLVIWVGALRDGVIDNLPSQALWNQDFTEDDFWKVVSHYTATYDEIKSSLLGRQFLYTKPLVKTTKNKKTISLNAYLNLFNFEHCIFWLIRDYYEKLGDQIFTSRFGVYFEKYFSELLGNCLNAGEYRRIPEEGKKRADWELTIDGFHILIEQKASLLGLNAKQQESDVQTMVKYCKLILFKALKQLRDTETDLKKAGEDPYIKVVLIYDTYVYPEIMSSALILPDCPVDDDRHYWCVNIREMEQLLWLCKTDRTSFDEVVRTYLDRSINNSPDGKAASVILSQNKIVKDGYLEQKQFIKYFDDVMDNIANHVKK